MRIASCYFKRLVFIVGLSALIFCLIQLLKSEIGSYDIDDRNEKLMQMLQLIKSSNEETHYIGIFFLSKCLKCYKDKKIIFRDGLPTCKLPHLDIFNPEIMQFIRDVPPLQCSPEDWVKAEGSKLFIVKNAKNQYGPITCAFNEILRIDDYNYKLTDTVETDKFYILRNSDYAEVNCKSQSGKQWHTVLAAVRDESSQQRDFSWNKVPKEALRLNVLMFGFDSLSRNTFARKLPHSNRYLQQNLGSIILNGYNIVGDGTPQALIPILTGKIELELPETRKRMGDKAHYVNVYPMIWKDYKQAGFITGYMEDVHHIGTFTYRLKGFDEQPTDHYMRTYYLAATPHFKYSNKFCMGGIPRHMVMINHIKSIFNKYKDQPKFVFGFHGELSHDSYNDIGVADDDVYNWLKDLKESGHLNNTLLILMSDHGHRFAEIRNTLQGKQEERLPFFSFTFPPWFKQVYPQAYANFVYNSQHLSTPFDIHATLKHILNFKVPKEGDIHNRGISLFDKIPFERKCSDAFIEPHWCACLSWQEVPLEQEVVQEAAQYFVKFLNSYTDEHRDICEKLRLEQIMWAAKLIPTKGLLHFEKSRDTDGFVSELSAKTKLTTELYQLKIKTLPGKGLFEASISRDVNKNILLTKDNDSISCPDLKKNHCTFYALHAWHKENCNTDTPLVIIIPDFESFSSKVLHNFIIILSSYIKNIKFVLIFGVATTLHVVHRSLSYDATSKLKVQVFHTQTQFQSLSDILDDIVLSPNIPFKLTGRAFKLLVDIFLYYDFSVQSFLQSYKLCMWKHFYLQKEKLICCKQEDIRTRVSQLTSEELKSLRHLVSVKKHLQSLKKTEINSNEFRKILINLLNDFHSYINNFLLILKCLHKLSANLPGLPFGKNFREIYAKAVRNVNLCETSEYKKVIQLIGFLSKEELLLSIKSILSILDDYETVPDCLIDKLKYHMSIIKDASLDIIAPDPEVNVCTENMNRSQWKEKLKINSHETRHSPYKEAQNNFLDYLNKEVFVKYLRSPDQVPINEIFCYNNALSVNEGIKGSMKASIHNSLNYPYYILGCNCCESKDEILCTHPDLTIIYKLHLEARKIINLYDWLQSFLAVIDPNKTDEEQDVDPLLHARFMRAVAELQFLGFIKATRKKTDHVKRLT